MQWHIFATDADMATAELVLQTAIDALAYARCTNLLGAEIFQAPGFGSQAHDVNQHVSGCAPGEAASIDERRGQRRAVDVNRQLIGMHVSL